jgi:glycosyltransferase involved in cell wall biosynthesis
VHFTVPDFVALEGIRYCQRNNIAYMGTWHSNYVDYLKYYFLETVVGWLLRSYLKSFFEQIPTVYVPTNYLLVKLREEFGYGTCTELKEWGRGVDMNMFSPDRKNNELRTSKGVNENDIVILWVSRLVPEKRPDIFLAVVKRLQEEGLPVKAFVVGNGTFEKYLNKLNDVTCCGWLSGVHLGEIYASSDILLFPSDVETFGNVTLEALSSGCPAVVEEKCSGHLVEHGVNGMCCKAGDNEAFFQATRALVVDNQRRRQMSIAAREGAWKFERNIILQQMAENYKVSGVESEATRTQFVSLLCLFL